MKNLIGYLNKTVLLFSIILFLFLNKSPILSQEGFDISTEFFHILNEENISTEVTITLSTSIDRVLTYYTATIPVKNLAVKCFDNNNTPLDCSTYDRDNATDILIDLNNKVIRKTDPLKIKLSYLTKRENKNSYTVQSYINDTVTESVSISYPKEKGEPLWSSDTIQNIKGSSDKYVITIQKPTSQNTSLIFGNSVTYSFNISRVLNNTLTEDNQTFELIVPSDTDHQTIIFENIDPLPNVSIKDKDGNYIFKYIIQQGKSVNLAISGYIQMHPTTSTTELNNSTLTQSIGYWNLTNTSELKRVSNYLKDNKGLAFADTLTDISDIKDDQTKKLLFKYLYQYVIERLDIKEDSSLGINNSVRLGANSLIEKPSQSSPEDYVDFTIALFRKFGIPAKMQIGYISNISGYNSDGFYHTWVEIYDSQDKKWMILDPYLEEYTKKSLYGSDFFDHINIITREISPVSPNLTFYNPNDFVIRSRNDITISPTLNAESILDIEDNTLVKKYITGNISLKNTGNVVITDYTILKSNIDLVNYIDKITDMNSKILLPKQNISVSLNIPSEKYMPDIFANLKLKNKDYLSKEILLQESIDVQPVPYLSVLSKLCSLAIFILIIFLLYSVIKKIKNRK